MRTGSAAQLFGQLADLIDDRSNRLDRIEKRCIRRDINAGHFCQLFRCLRASGGQYLFPVIDSGLAFGFDALADLCGNGQSGAVGLGVKSHIVMRLAHPGERCVIGNFHIIAPELLQGLFHNAA